MPRVSGPGDRQYRPRVVVVDDDPSVLRAVSRFLKLDCDVVASVDNGQEAIEAAVRLKPDVLVTDFMMPQMNGLDVCRRMKDVAPETDVVIVTAYADKHAEKLAFQAGAAAFISKPSAPGVLGNTIRRLVENRKTSQWLGDSARSA